MCLRVKTCHAGIGSWTETRISVAFGFHCPTPKPARDDVTSFFAGRPGLCRRRCAAHVANWPLGQPIHDSGAKCSSRSSHASPPPRRGSGGDPGRSGPDSGLASWLRTRCHSRPGCRSNRRSHAPPLDPPRRIWIQGHCLGVASQFKGPIAGRCSSRFRLGYQAFPLKSTLACRLWLGCLRYDSASGWQHTGTVCSGQGHGRSLRFFGPGCARFHREI